MSEYSYYSIEDGQDGDAGPPARKMTKSGMTEQNVVPEDSIPAE